MEKFRNNFRKLHFLSSLFSSKVRKLFLDLMVKVAPKRILTLLFDFFSPPSKVRITFIKLIINWWKVSLLFLLRVRQKVINFFWILHFTFLLIFVSLHGSYFPLLYGFWYVFFFSQTWNECYIVTRKEIWINMANKSSVKYKRFNIDEYSSFYFVLSVYLCKTINISDGQAKSIPWSMLIRMLDFRMWN